MVHPNLHQYWLLIIPISKSDSNQSKMTRNLVKSIQNQPKNWLNQSKITQKLVVYPTSLQFWSLIIPISKFDPNYWLNRSKITQKLVVYPNLHQYGLLITPISKFESNQSKNDPKIGGLSNFSPILVTDHSNFQI